MEFSNRAVEQIFMYYRDVKRTLLSSLFDVLSRSSYELT